MVRNNTGGNKSKGLARKSFIKKQSALRTASEEGEIYAQAVKVMGGNIASAVDINGKPLRAHIRRKFRGHGKRDNFISPGTWLLVGLHEWQTDKTNFKKDYIRDCDILEVYNESDKILLKNSINDVNWSQFIMNDNKLNTSTNNEDLGFSFMDETTQEYENLIAISTTKVPKTDIIMDDNDIEINVDDI